MIDTGLLEQRYRSVRSGIPAHVKLIAVSKTRSVEEIQALYDLGHRDFGENYPQELRDKHPALPADIQWHFIGHLQTNKVKYVAPVASVVQTVDGDKLLDELNKRAVQSGRQIKVLVQIHIAQEETKHGLSAEEAKELLTNWNPDRWPALIPAGLMGMATNTEDQEQVRREFRGLTEFFRRMKHGSQHLNEHFTELSMGMSGDAAIAIEEGSTMVRIGTAIFGDR
jgi:pyridoxal phosphate enzyme (YggS family)